MSKGIDTVRTEVTEANTDWTRIRHVMAGSRAVKQADTLSPSTYLPKPNPFDESAENKARYTQYITRAVFFNASRKTLNGMLGIALRQRPQVELPRGLEVLETDTDGAGGSLYNQAHRTLEEVLGTGRAGLLADYPRGLGETSKAELEAQNIHPVISQYAPENIINWRFNEKGELILVVLYEPQEIEDGYGTDSIDQWRELALVEGIYLQNVWQVPEGGNEPVIVETIVPQDASGRPWTEIPFSFVGAIDNNAEIDASPMLDIVELNIAHYRNSADYFESAYFNGQPTHAMTGLNQTWYDDNFKGGDFYVGCRAIVPLPEGADLKIVQAQPNTLSSEAMEKLEKQMIALGARLMLPGEVVKTAEQSRSETAAAHSVLSLACDNVSAAYERVLKWAAAFAGESDEITFRINTDFVGLMIDANLVNAIVGAWQGAAIPESDKNAALRAIGLIDPEKTDEAIADEMEMEGGGLNLDDDDAGDQQAIV